LFIARPTIAKLAITMIVATSLQTTQGKKISSSSSNTNGAEENNDQEHQ
jgi:hypothetical protein